MLTFQETQYLDDLQELFFLSLEKKYPKTPLESLSVLDLREFFYEYFKRTEFSRLYDCLVREIAEKQALDLDRLLLQPLPTGRVFPPGAHGTSWHTDYLYGHGEKTITIWVPIYGVTPGSSFKYISDNKINNQLVQKIFENPEFLLGEIAEKKDVREVIPADGSIAIFDSNQLHCSHENTSNSLRLSFDFRISLDDDTTTTKNLAGYFRLTKSGLKKPNPERKLSFLKYILGGRGFDTAAQHILIGGLAQDKSMKIIGQEAEVERLGLTMLNHHLKEINSGISKFDAIILASKTLFSDDEFERVRKNSCENIYCCAEGEWI